MNEIRITRDRLNECMEKMCDGFCIWPIQSTNDETLALHCEECPLNNINDDDFWNKEDEE